MKTNKSMEMKYQCGLCGREYSSELEVIYCGHGYD